MPYQTRRLSLALAGISSNTNIVRFLEDEKVGDNSNNAKDLTMLVNSFKPSDTYTMISDTSTVLLN